MISKRTREGLIIVIWHFFRNLTCNIQRNKILIGKKIERYFEVRKFILSNK